MLITYFSQICQNDSMSTRPTPMTDARKAGQPLTKEQLEHGAREHLWPHFTRTSLYDGGSIPIITKAEGKYIWDQHGNKLYDGLSGLFSVNAGHGHERLAEAAKKQLMQMDFVPLWSFAHPPAIELGERLLSYAPKGLERVFFTTGGGEANETAWKLAKQYFKLVGKPMKHKVLTRKTAYHGTSHGALSLTGIPNMKKAFEPLVPSTFRVPNTNWYRAKEDFATEEEFGLWAANRVEEMIIMEDPDTVAAFFLEPVQNSGGAYTSHKSYFKRVREICDKYDVILVADETIDGFGRTGTMFASEKYEFEPDMLVCAKAITNSVLPLGALMIKEKFYEPFTKGTTIFPHGYTFAASPAACAVAIENLDLYEDLDLINHVQANEANFKKTLDKLSDLDIVGDVRGTGYFYAIELVKDKATKARFDLEEIEKLLRGFITKDLYNKGLYCRADDRGDPVVQLAPPLTADQADFDMMEANIRETLTKAWDIVK